MSETTPIFLISQPRSGSTVLQAVLSNHPEVATTAEPWIQLMRIPFVMPGKVSSHADWKLVQEACHEAGTEVGSDLFGLADAQIIELTRRYYAEAGGGRTYFLDKTPRYYYLLDRLFEDFPTARFIILERHPASVVRSIQKTWGVRLSLRRMLYFADDLLLAPEKIRSFLQTHGGDPRVRRICYEDLVEDPEAVTAPLFEWLGLDFSPGLLVYKDNRKYSGTLGDPNAPQRDRIEAKPLPRGEAFLGKRVSLAEKNFCMGLVRHHELHGWPVPRKEYWLPGRRSFGFDYFLWASGRGRDARRGLAWQVLFRIERIRRQVLYQAIGLKRRLLGQHHE